MRWPGHAPETASLTRYEEVATDMSRSSLQPGPGVPPRVLYLGDHAGGSALYLLGVLEKAGFSCVHRDRSEDPPEALQTGNLEWDVVILSDYPARRLGPRADQALATAVSQGRTGLIMFGGWESFTGRGGDYRDTAVAGVLPVRMGLADDRRNIPSGLLLWPATSSHPLVHGLNFRRPPVVVGCNAVTPRKTAQVLLLGLEVRIKSRGRTPALETGAARPLLVVGPSDGPRVAAFATDPAPHWCGGLVDWGRARVTAGRVEVGESYLEFLSRLVSWAGGRLPPLAREE